MSSIHSQRAKRWETNVFVAEWLANAFEYCHKTPEGKEAFERWWVASRIHFFSDLNLETFEQGNTKVRTSGRTVKNTLVHGTT
jgi:hypothetical protein